MTHTTVTSFDPHGEAACEMLIKPTVKGGAGLGGRSRDVPQSARADWLFCFFLKQGDMQMSSCRPRTAGFLARKNPSRMQYANEVALLARP